MPDVLADGRYGRDEGVKCHKCGGTTYLVDDQGRGLKSYQCDHCDESTMVQFEYDEPDEDSDGY
jgi:hypothetical protein